MAQLHELDALAQGAAVRAGEVSPVELVEQSLRRIEALDPELGAFITVTADLALGSAREAEVQLRNGGDLGPLFGVPTAIKDLASTAGVRTTFGSRAFASFVPTVDSHTVTLLRRAGLISLGKTNTPDWGCSLYTDNDVALPGRTPWDTTKSSGGSSGGAAAAVASGMMALAHGTDGGGSLRIPASVCGVFGYKPSRGRVSNGPLGMDVTGLSVAGPIARTVADAAAMLDVLAVPMPGDPYWAPPQPSGFLSAARRQPGRMRIASHCDTQYPVDPQVRRAYEEAAQLLRDLGHVVEEIEEPWEPALADHFETAWGIQALNMPVAPSDEDKLQPMTRYWRERGRKTSGEQLFTALAGLQLGARRALERLEPYDAILTPTLAQLPQSSQWFRATDDRELERVRQTAYCPYTAAYNISGQPAASLPVGWSDEGLPLGIMLAGRPNADAALLSLCAQVEAARPWANRRPPL